MPGLNGMQTFLRMREFIKCPVVLMTAYAETGVSSEFFSAGGSGFLIKPLDFDTLHTQLQLIVDQAPTIDYGTIATPPAEKLPTLLLIDDESSFSNFVAKTLKDKFHILWAERGDKGIALLKNSKVDVVLLDYLIPGGNGLDIFKLIRYEVPKHPPVILVTAHASVPMSTYFMYNGGAYVLEKPVSKEELTRVIEMVLDKRHVA